MISAAIAYPLRAARSPLAAAIRSSARSYSTGTPTPAEPAKRKFTNKQIAIGAAVTVASAIEGYAWYRVWKGKQDSEARAAAEYAGIAVPAAK